MRKHKKSLRVIDLVARIAQARKRTKQERLRELTQLRDYIDSMLGLIEKE